MVLVIYFARYHFFKSGEDILTAERFQNNVFDFSCCVHDLVKFFILLKHKYRNVSPQLN